MRTTLKRGVGRGAAANGNGHAVLPPGVLTPIKRYRQPARERSAWRTLGKVLFFVVVLCSIAVFGGAGGVYLETVAAVNDLGPQEEVKIAAKALDVLPANAPANALVIGYDHRPEDGTAPSRSDTVMLLRADPNAKTISMLSFPRDLVVQVRCPDGRTAVDRINAAYSYCGPEGTLETVRSVTGLPIHYIITVNFDGFRKVVDSLNGVWLDVDRRYLNKEGGDYATINLWPGYQRLRGWQALDFVRYRHSDSDLYRLARQQLFVKAVKQAVNASFKATSVPKIVGAMRKNVQIGKSGGEGIDLKTLTSYGLFAYGLPSGHFFQVKIGGLVGMNELTTDPSNIRVAVEEFTNPDVEAPEKATAVALRRRARLATGPSPRNVSVVVLNGNGVPGAAANATYQLAQRGYRTIAPPEGYLANAPRRYFRTTIYFAPKQGSRVAAARVGNLFGSADLRPLLGNPRIQLLSNGAMLTVVLGQTYTGDLAPAPVDRTPERKEAEVRPGAAEMGPWVRKAAQWKLPFRVLVPTVLERSSRLDPEHPYRVYKIGKRKAVRFTFRSGPAANEYWGIQMTDWDDAPALREPNTTQKLGGREYQLYYNGPHLHMVVLREGGATYWVVNTLLDSLNNETMLAIARGLKPSRK